MANHDYVIANADGATVRADINSALAAIVSNNSSSSEPSTKYAYMWWFDTSSNILKLRNSGNDAWVTIATIDQTADTANIVFNDANQTFTKAQRGSITQVNSASNGTITPDFALNNHFLLSDNAGNGTLANDNSGAYTLANPSNLVAGQTGSIFVVQDGSGSRTLAYGSKFKTAGGSGITLSTAANAVDRIDYIVHTTSLIQIVGTLAYA
tara:strand:+ start:214 stop:843 length:630 start_codon:yes stop_codon:yes gene_type:complete